MSVLKVRGIRHDAASTDAINLDSSGNVGIGTASPINNSGYGGLTLNGTSGSLFSLMTNGTESGRIASLGNETSIQCKASTGYISFVQGVSGGTERMRIDSSGRVTMPYQPAFRATGDNNGQSLTSSTATIVIFDVAETNIGNHYNVSNGRFTAPIAGFYHFSASLLVTKGGSTRIDCSFMKNGGYWMAAEMQGLTTTNTNATVTNSVDGYLNAGDYIQVETRINDNGSVYAEAKFWNFSGFLVG